MFGLFKSMVKNDAYENLDAREFLTKANITPDAVLLDVRTPGEYNAESIDGAINIDFFDAEFADRIGRLDKEKSYFVFCRSGQRSANACRVMYKLGFFKLYNMAGGVIALG